MQPDTRLHVFRKCSLVFFTAGAYFIHDEYYRGWLEGPVFGDCYQRIRNSKSEENWVVISDNEIFSGSSTCYKRIRQKKPLKTYTLFLLGFYPHWVNLNSVTRYNPPQCIYSTGNSTEKYRSSLTVWSRIFFNMNVPMNLSKPNHMK